MYTLTHMYIHILTHVSARPHAYSYTYAQLCRVRTILSRGGEPPEECAFLVIPSGTIRVIPSGTMVSHVPRLPNNKITAAMFAQRSKIQVQICGGSKKGASM